MTAPAPLPTDAEREELVGSWSMYQRRGGHRASTDDVVTAWLAVRGSSSAPARYLDLGCGVGTVLLLTAHALRPGRSVGIEAQDESHTMCARSIAELPDPPAIQLLHGDFRSVDVAALGPFDLVTGSPPYFPEGTGVLPADPQRRACRFELRGGVEDYAIAAARVLAPGGRFVVVFPSAGAARAQAAAGAAGLHERSHARLWMREGRPAPFLDVWCFAREPGDVERLSFAIRYASGAVSDDYATARALLGLRRG